MFASVAQWRLKVKTDKIFRYTTHYCINTRTPFVKNCITWRLKKLKVVWTTAVHVTL